MEDRHKFFIRYLQDFSRSYEKALSDFEVTDKIYLTEEIIAVLRQYKQEPQDIDYEKIRALHDGLLNKYGKLMREFVNTRLTDYFSVKSPRQLEVHTEKLKEVNGAIHGSFDEDDFLTEEERQRFLTQTEQLLLLDKQYLYLLRDPQPSVATNSSEETEANEKHPDFTSRRRALAIHYLDKHFKISPTGSKKPLAELTHFLSGNSFDKIYKVLRNPLNYGSDSVKEKAEKSLVEDLNFIRSYFDRLELTEVVKTIDKDIASFA